MFFFCSHWSLEDVPLISFCPADDVPDWQPRIILGMVEARSVNVKKTTTRNTKIGQVSTVRSPATKSPLLLMTNQNTTSPALHHQNQPPDSGSVHESQRRQLRLSLHRSHRNTCCVCFCFRVFYNFRGEKRRSLYCSSSSHQKSVSADDKSKHNKPSPSSPEPTS